MPIKAELRAQLYNTRPWQEQRARVFARAGGRCECKGECGKDHVGFDLEEPDDAGRLRCAETHATPATGDGLRKDVLVVLTTAHIDHTSGARVADDELLALCTGCHLRFDLDSHLQQRYRNRLLELERRGQVKLL